MLYWMAATILTVLNGACVVANMLMLPGNWLMVGTLCVFLLAVGTTSGGPDWSTLIVVLVLAVVGEVLEAITGSAKAAQKGASRRAMVLSLIASMVGSVAGALLVPIPPVVGSVMGAIVGAAAGAPAARTKTLDVVLLLTVKPAGETAKEPCRSPSWYCVAL